MKRHSQRPVKGGRDALPSCVVHKIKVEIERTARRFEVSKSFVVSTILAEAFDINIDERYYDYERVTRTAKDKKREIRRRNRNTGRELTLVKARKKA